MIVTTTDKTLISKIVNHPDVFLWVSDDMAVNPYTPEMHDRFTYLTNENKNSIIQIEPMNGATCQVHISATPEAWGSCHDFVKDAIEWGFKNTGFLKIVGIIPAYNQHVKKLLVDLGFEKEGVLKKSFLKDWCLHDQEIYGLSKYKEAICHKQQE